MLKLDQMEVLVGATIGMLEENLAELTDPKLKEETEKQKAHMEELFEQIKFAQFMEHMMEGVKMES